MQKDMMTTPYNPVAVNTGSKLLIIDTGTGEANYKKTNGVGGQFIANLTAAGIERTAVDAVIISHYHGDHINGLLMADNSLTYPNAEILVSASEHKYWMDDGEMSRAGTVRVETNFKNVRRVFNAEVMKHVRTYEWGKDVVPGITVQGTPGHTPGHTSYVIASGSEQVYVQSDVTHVPFLFVRIPTGTPITTRMAPWQKPLVVRFTICWRRRRCGCRAFTTRSRRSPMWRRTVTAIATFRCRGARRSDRKAFSYSHIGSSPMS